MVMPWPGFLSVTGLACAAMNLRRVIHLLLSLLRRVCRIMVVIRLSPGMPLTIMVAMDIFSGMASVYDLIVGDNSSYYDALLSAMQERYPWPENAIVADIGGGTGLFTFHICNCAKKVLLIDPSDAMLRVAKEKSAGHSCDNVEMVKGAFPGCGLVADSIDIIVMLGTIQYLAREDQPVALREIYRCLKPGGLAFMDVVNYFSFVGQPVAPGTKRWDASGLKIVQKTTHEVHPFREEWIDMYRITVENARTGERKELESRHVLKMMSPTEVYLLLLQAGFSSIDMIPWPGAEIGLAEKVWCFAKK